MKHPASVVAFALLLASVAASQDPSTLLPPASGGPDAVGRGIVKQLQHFGLPATSQVWFDEVDGTPWVRGASYKASFGDGAATVIPYLGSAAPRNFPVTFRLAEVSAGGSSIPLAAAGFARSGSRMIAERGPVRELYDLRPAEIEQLCVLDRRLGAGEIVVRIEVETELDGVETDAGIEFSNALGGVRYGKATAVDAAGASTPMATRLVDGAIELKVSADFAAAAVYPLTIDPVLLIFGASTAPQSIYDFNVDVAYDASTDSYLIVYEEAYSATDHDIGARAFDANGIPIPNSMAYIDYTSTWWANPKVANSNLYDQFLVVAEKKVTLGGGFQTTEIWGRTRYAAQQFVMGPQFQIGSAAFHAGPLTHPDVGGDPSPYGPTYYCVVYQVWSGAIEYVMVAQTSSLASGWIALASGGKSNPSISKGNGVFFYPQSQEWIIVWQHTYSPTDEDIEAARIAWNGTTISYPFWVDTSSLSDDQPSVSSLTAVLPGVGVVWMAVYERDISGTERLRARVFSGTTPLTGSVDLSTLFGAPSGSHHQSPCVDTDGCRFAIGYSESCGIFCQDALPRCATVHLEPGPTISLTEGPQLLNGYVGPDLLPQVTSTHSAGGAPTRYLFVWHTLSTYCCDSFAHAALYDGHSPSAQSAAQWFNYVTPTCGSITLTMSGRPALGEPVGASLAGFIATPYLVIGPPIPPTPLCPLCLLVVDPFQATVIQSSTFSATVPLDGSLVDLQLAIQGADMGAGGGCTGPSFTLSQGVIVTII